MDKKPVALKSKRLSLLIWKNMILRKRHWVITSFQVILPVILILAFAIINSIDTSRQKPRTGHGGKQVNGQNLQEDNMMMFGVEDLYKLAALQLNYTTVAFTPSNAFTDKLIKSVGDSFRAAFPGSVIDWKGFPSEAKIESTVKPQFLKEPSYRKVPTNDISAAIIFKKRFLKVSSVPTEGVYSYTLRFASNLFKTNELFPINGESLGAGYVISGFAGLQLCLDYAIINEITNSIVVLPLSFMTMPQFGPGNSSKFFAILPLILILSFIFIVPSVVREVVSERESGIKELMRIMGLPNWMHLLGWILDSIIFLSITVTLVTFLLFVNFGSNSSALIMYSSAVLGWIVIFVYCMASVALCIFIASFFEQTALATTLGLVFWILSYFGIALIVEQRYYSLNTWLAAFLCVIPNVGVTLCLKNMNEFENTGEGATWGNLFKNASVLKHDWLSLGHILIVMIASTLFYLLLAMYVENVLPYKYGVRKPWYYIFTSGCVHKPKIVDSGEIGNKVGDEVKAGEYFEDDPVGVEPGMEIINLSKQFGNGKVAVNNLSLNIFKGQITALLGHNGAGKTTTMSILTGIISPTHGTVIIDGHNIRNDIEGARQNMGLCPQHNMLFDRLTVKEHLLFFSKLKQGKTAETGLEIEHMMTQLDMIKKLDVMSKSLSGGQKRKLNLGMALIGGSRVVILDEPTSGMDPESRRGVWDVLMSMRASRTILLTTHMMEEADVLGDRIAIMAEGRLKCCGSPTFLKNKYGAGYTIRMTLVDKAYADQILETVRQHVNDASFKGMPNALELAVVLPSLENSTVFPSLFSDLESNREKLGIKSVGLSLTTMDEIFMKVILMDRDIEADSEAPSARQTNSRLLEQLDRSDTHNANSKHNEQINYASKSNLISTEKSAISHLPKADDQEENNTVIPVHEPTKTTGMHLRKLQFNAIFMKRVHYSRRKLKILLLQLIILLVLVIWTIIACNKYRSADKDSNDQPSFRFTLSSYSNPVTPYREGVSTSLNLGAFYAEAVGKSAVKVAGSGPYYMLKYLVSKANHENYKKSYIVAADFDVKISDDISGCISYYSDLPNHALPLSVNLISNAVLRNLSKDMSGKGDFSIEVHAHPLQSRYWDFSKALRIAQIGNKGFSGFTDIFVSLIGIGLAVVAAFLVIFPAEERITKAKQLQLMTGVGPIIFWGTSLLWDFLVLFFIICIILVCFPIFQVYNVFTANNAVGVLFAILLVYAFSSICFAYAVSLFVKRISDGFSLIASVNIFFGLVLSNYITIEENILFSNGRWISNQIGRVVPFFGIARCLHRFIGTTSANTRCIVLRDEFPDLQCNNKSEIKTCCDCPRGTPLKQMQMAHQSECFQIKPYILWWEGKFFGHNWVEVPGIGQELFFAFIVGLFYFLLVLCIDSGLLKPLFALCHYRRHSPVIMAERDVDVIEEEKRIESQISSGSADDGVAISNITKIFWSFRAVNGLTFGVSYGECFGLLGVNGAGKTTFFRILTGDIGPSYGDAFIGPHNMRKHWKKFFAQIGYCPQFDAILGVLSGKEMLQLFSRLRGCPNTSEETTKWLTKIGLLDSANVQCQKYSGGMKRRLSTAMALIGDPPVVMLDEPTSGVDPVARRQFWHVIRSNRELGQAIILTSHSMDECEALCSRLAIMVNGQFQCFGGVQHIKSKYGEGFTMTFKLKPTVRQDSPRLLSLMVEIENNFRPCALKDRHENILQYQVYKTDLHWKDLFTVLEELKIQYSNEIEDYSATATTLDEVFLSFARQQYPAWDGGTGCCPCFGSSSKKK